MPVFLWGGGGCVVMWVYEGGGNVSMMERLMRAICTCTIHALYVHCTVCALYVHLITESCEHMCHQSTCTL